jgi:hypothetical protein
MGTRSSKGRATLEALPLRVYLDTSDYAAFSADPLPEGIRRIKEFLLSQVSSSRIEIGFSWAILNELIQDFDEEHRQNRVKRAATVKEICGTCAFCYPTELNDGRTFSRDGYWFPREAMAFNIQAVEKAWMKAVGSNKILIPNRSQRNALKNVKHRRKALQQHPNLADLTRADLGLIPLTDEFVNGQYLYRFMIGEMSAEVANRELLKIVTDPVLYIVSWFDMAGKSNTFTKDMQVHFHRIEEDLQKVIHASNEARRSLKEMKRLERDLYRLSAPAEVIVNHKHAKSKLERSIDVRNALKGREKLHELFGAFGLEVMAAYLNERVDPNGMKARSSDLVDIIHALYIPHCDLWRGDSTFSNMLIKRSVPYSDRVVARLSELPARIEALKEARGIS